MRAASRIAAQNQSDNRDSEVVDDMALDAPQSFADLELSAPILQALTDVGYESPSPIQAATIPHLLAGKDVLGQAQTGTGKTAAFALPILSKLTLTDNKPRALVLAPTRELAIQVAEAFKKYAAHLPRFNVLPIYGGQSYTPQLQSLRRGAHVIVGTPGRVMDHIEKGTLDLSSLEYLVLDEADEMLRMGFIDDVEWILERVPKTRQIALFSATMPPPIRRIAQKYLNSPAEVTIRSKTSTATNIRQRYWIVGGMHKLDALTRVLEVEPFDAMLVFARTKQSTIELAEKLEARGFAVEALNGDIQQNVRERTIARLKAKQIDIVVATDVAARGLDVDRISHVVNFDVPYDSESYVHRIGRTGRAGRSGEAILFISPRERNMLRVIERATRQPIEQMNMPSADDVNHTRIARFKDKITAVLASGESQRYRFIVEQYEQENNVPALEVAAALVSMAQGKTPLLLDRSNANSDAGNRSSSEKAWAAPAVQGERFARRDERSRDDRPREDRPREDRPREDRPRAERKPREEFSRPARADKATPRSAPPRNRDEQPTTFSLDEDADIAPRNDKFDTAFQDAPRPRRRDGEKEAGMETYRLEVGSIHGIKPGNIVGAIANEAGLEGKLIGRVDIREDHSFVDLPEGMPKQIFRDLQKTRVGGQELRISRADAPQPQHARHLSTKPRFPGGKGPHPGGGRPHKMQHGSKSRK